MENNEINKTAETLTYITHALDKVNKEYMV